LFYICFCCRRVSGAYKWYTRVISLLWVIKDFRAMWSQLVALMSISLVDRLHYMYYLSLSCPYIQYMMLRCMVRLVAVLNKLMLEPCET